MEGYELFLLTIFIVLDVSATIIYFYLLIRKVALVRKIKKSGRLISTTPLILALLNQGQLRTRWFSPTGGYQPPPPAYDQVVTQSCNEPVYSEPTTPPEYVNVSEMASPPSDLPPSYESVTTNKNIPTAEHQSVTTSTL